MKNIWPTVEKNIKSSIYRRGGKVAGYKPTAADDLAGKGIGDGKTGSGDKGDEKGNYPGKSKKGRTL